MSWTRLIVIMSLLAASPMARAWNKGGHMVSAGVAYANLKLDAPAALAKAVELLKEHPQYESTWLPRLNAMMNASEEDRQLMLLMLAARWPDDARGNEEFHHSHWHYINLPFKPDGQPDSVIALAPDSDNILRAYELNLAKVKNAGEDAEDRAVALCWVLHLIGDSHQPLHVTQLFSTQFPKGDRGGNKFFIRAKSGATGISLHQYWDDLVIGSDRFQSVRNRATELRLRPEHARDKLGELKENRFEQWVTAESLALAKDVAYRHGKLAGGSELPEAITLPEDYVLTAKPAAEKRIVLAGYRMADVIKKAMESKR